MRIYDDLVTNMRAVAREVFNKPEVQKLERLILAQISAIEPKARGVYADGGKRAPGNGIDDEHYEQKLVSISHSTLTTSNRRDLYKEHHKGIQGRRRRNAQASRRSVGKAQKNLD